MMTFRRSFLLGLAALALAGCASKPSISRVADPDVDFHSYRTFAFVRANGNPSLIDRRFLAAARSQMERRGYAFDERAPDLLVNIAAVVEDQPGQRATPGNVPGGERVGTEDYRLGRMAIDLIDPRRRQVIWHGVAEGRVTPAMLRDAGTAAEKAVAAIFDTFPVKASSTAAAPAPKAHQ
ncbi:DUF4136 domain-containing protein [Rivibacter subsaxonicus]|uniref:Uncharacterized protein DUF4136 n=1 Tax=Rivibacter subsaxonicus TaxID=457575 RepID=A0A4Q7VNT5_9BURK|nr:DUF4136 domain-containing protein [Rivibacter subsaxonicus]RZT97788.1 uncharacterized protein DUF4136 [Rivibacter subsaxonicus]